MAVVRPSLTVETACRAELGGWIAGVDEVGRGAWAGPLSVAVAVVPDGFAAVPDGVADSKTVAEPAREQLWEPVGQWCAAWGVGHASPQECDDLRMAAALVLATGRALAQLPENVWPSAVVVDGKVDFVTPAVEALGQAPVVSAVMAGLRAGVPAVRPVLAVRPVPAVRPVVHGDVTCASVAAASILAKVVRDRIMRAESAHFPPFDFDRNKGYPSPAHRRALMGYGLTSIHRRSWSYVRRLPWAQTLGAGSCPGPRVGP